jgi:hypothetical protein
VAIALELDLFAELAVAFLFQVLLGFLLMLVSFAVAGEQSVDLGIGKCFCLYLYGLSRRHVDSERVELLL